LEERTLRAEDILPHPAFAAVPELASRADPMVVLKNARRDVVREVAHFCAKIDSLQYAS